MIGHLLEAIQNQIKPARKKRKKTDDDNSPSRSTFIRAASGTPRKKWKKLPRPIELTDYIKILDELQLSV